MALEAVEQGIAAGNKIGQSAMSRMFFHFPMLISFPLFFCCNAVLSVQALNMHFTIEVSAKSLN